MWLLVHTIRSAIPFYSLWLYWYRLSRLGKITLFVCDLSLCAAYSVIGAIWLPKLF
jgi:hypothetical protein